MREYGRGRDLIFGAKSHGYVDGATRLPTMARKRIRHHARRRG